MNNICSGLRVQCHTEVAWLNWNYSVSLLEVLVDASQTVLCKSGLILLNLDEKAQKY